nr:1-phosphatidylinositol-3-phosphate 5-kinase FAB1B-like [Tanacetum cinerariifolium]
MIKGTVPQSNGHYAYNVSRILVASCMKQGGLAASAKNGVQESSLDLSTSPSAGSLISMKSSCTDDSSSSVTFTSVLQSVFTYRLTYYPTEFSEQQSVVMETNLDEHKEMLLDAVVQSASDFGYFTNRGDESDEEYAYQLAAGDRHLLHIENGYDDDLQMDDMDNDYESHKVNPDGQPADAKSVDSALTGAQALEEKEDVNDVSDESEVEASSSSSIYATTQQQEDVPDCGF